MHFAMSRAHTAFLHPAASMRRGGARASRVMAMRNAALGASAGVVGWGIRRSSPHSTPI
jgi:hypothetical protein